MEPAAAVRFGQVTFAHGNDEMGSVRIPAANCGLFGIKPGSGLVPQHIGVDAWIGMSENGPLATTVADAALCSVMAGRPELASPLEPSRPLRIAIPAGEPSLLVSLDAESRRGLTETADALRARVYGLFADYDLLLTPTLAQPGPLAENLHERGWWANILSNIRHAPYPSTCNLLGWPAASIPVAWPRVAPGFSD